MKLQKDYKQRANQYRKHLLEDDKMERANKPHNATTRTTFITQTAQKMVAIARQKLSGNRKEWLVNDSYMQKITNCGERQNRNTIRQINGIQFNIKRDRTRKVWIFKKIDQQNTKRKPIAVSKSSTDQQTKGVEPTLFKNNSSKRTRSIKSNSFNSNNFKSSQFEKPQKLNELESITQEESSILQSKSGRYFTLKAMNEILKDMGNRIVRFFLSRKQFLDYFAKALKFEKRDAVKCQGDNFYIKANTTKEEVVEFKTMADREKYLNQVEDAAIHSRCDYTQLKAKIASSFPLNKAYELLSNMISARKIGEVSEIKLTKTVELTDHFKNLLKEQLNAVGGFNGTEVLTIL